MKTNRFCSQPDLKTFVPSRIPCTMTPCYNPNLMFNVPEETVLEVIYHLFSRRNGSNGDLTFIYRRNGFSVDLPFMFLKKRFFVVIYRSCSRRNGFSGDLIYHSCFRRNGFSGNLPFMFQKKRFLASKRELRLEVRTVRCCMSRQVSLRLKIPWVKQENTDSLRLKIPLVKQEGTDSL